MTMIIEYLPGVLGAICIALLAWAIFGDDNKRKQKRRGQIKHDIYRWDDRATHHD